MLASSRRDQSGSVCSVEPAVVQRDREEEDEEPADQARGHEHGELVAGEELNHERAGHRREGEADPQDAGDLSALGGRHLVRKYGHHGGEQRVEGQLGDAPPQEDDGDAGGERDHQNAPEPTPRPVTIHGRRIPSRAAVRSLIRPNTGFATRASRLPMPVTSPRLLRGALDSDERVDLQGQGDQHGGEERRTVPR